MTVKKHKPKSWNHLDAARSTARTTLGAPPPTRVQPNPKKKKLSSPRHRDTLDRLLTSA